MAIPMAILMAILIALLMVIPTAIHMLIPITIYPYNYLYVTRYSLPAYSHFIYSSTALAYSTPQVLYNSLH